MSNLDLVYYKKIKKGIYQWECYDNKGNVGYGITKEAALSQYKIMTADIVNPGSVDMSKYNVKL